VADGLANSKIGPDRVLELVSALAGRDVPTGQSADELRRLLLAAVLDDLENNANESPAIRGGPLLDRAEAVVAESCRQRASLFNVSPAAISAAQGPAQTLELLAASLAESVSRGKTNDSLAARLPHELKAAQYLAGGELPYTVAVQKLLIDLSARRIAAQRPQRAAAARQIAAESAAFSAVATSALTQLRDQEAALLKLWMLYAPEA
jgi:hypothetical protein